MSEVVLRPARKADAPGILRCLAALSEQDGAVHRATEEDYRRHGFGPDRLFQCLVVETGGRIAGVAVFFPSFSTQRGRPGVYVQDLYLAPELHGQGLGRRLLGAVRAQAAAWGGDHVVLMVARSNEAALGFYGRMGFRPMEDYLAMALDGSAAANPGEVG